MGGGGDKGEDCLRPHYLPERLPQPPRAAEIELAIPGVTCLADHVNTSMILISTWEMAVVSLSLILSTLAR